MNRTDRTRIRLEAGDALVVVDVQTDFLPGGCVALPKSEEVIPILNKYLVEFALRQLPIFATRNWHPPNHRSFQPQGGRWPIHCLAHSRGAQLAAGLALPPWTVVLSKDAETTGCSGFQATNLESRLRGSGLRRLFIGGFTAEHSVLSTVKDAISFGFEVVLLRDAIRAANVQAGLNAEAEMVGLGAVPVRVQDLIPCNSTPPPRKTRI